MPALVMQDAEIVQGVRVVRLASEQSMVKPSRIGITPVPVKLECEAQL